MDDYEIQFENGNIVRAINGGDTATHTYEFHGWDAMDAATDNRDTNVTTYTWGGYAMPERINWYRDNFVLNIDSFGRITISSEEAAQHSESVKEANDKPDLEDEKGGALDDFLDEFSERQQQA